MDGREIHENTTGGDPQNAHDSARGISPHSGTPPQSISRSLQNEWVQQLIAATKRLAPKDFFGKVEINLQGGGVSNVNLVTSIKDREGS
jgi:hypothetical protein